MITNDQRLYEGNNGKAILLMHGIAGGAAQLFPMSQFLNNYGYTVYSTNLAGHGTYPEDLLHTTCEDMMAKAEYDYQLLAANYDEVYVGGYSTGAILAFYLASKHPEIAGVISYSAPAWLVPGTFITAEYPPEQVYFHRDPAGKTGLAKIYHIHYEEIAINIFRELEKLEAVTRDPELLAKVKCPTIIVQAKNDAIAEPKSCHYFYEHIASEKKELYNPDTGDHSIALTEGRHEAFRRTAMFLESL